jgi:Reverse transcriptase (RNA-dependent DNA polymerase)/Endonuclease-reverse transcriptase
MGDGRLGRLEMREKRNQRKSNRNCNKENNDSRAETKRIQLGFSVSGFLEEEKIDDDTRKKENDQNAQVKNNRKGMERKERRKEEIVVATINLVSLNGRIEEVIDVMKNNKLDVLGCSETKWKGEGTKQLREGYKLWWSGGKEGRNGVGFVTNEKVTREVIDVENINDRVIKLKMKIGKKNIEVIQVYAPQVGREKKEKDEFISQLENEMITSNSENILIMGDFNAKVGEDRNGYEDVMGKNGYGRRDKEGEVLLDFCKRNGLFICNTNFKKMLKEEKVTRVSWDGRNESVIDYIIVGKNMRKSVRDTKVLHKINLDTDHRLLASWIMKDRKWKRHKGKKKECMKGKIKSWKLFEEEKRIEFKKKIEENFPKESELFTVEEEWNRYKKEVVKIAEEICGRTGIKRKRKETHWWSEEVQEMVKRKNNCWQKLLSSYRTDELEIEYRKIKNEVKKCVDKEKIRTMIEWAEKLETDFEGNKKMIYGIIENKKRDNEIQRYMRYKGEVTNDKEKIIEMWEEYFQKLLNGEKRESQMEVEQEVKSSDENMISMTEMEQAVKKMKNGRAPGIDEVTIEMIKAGGSAGIEWLFRIIRAAWKENRVPEDWTRGEIVVIFKKGDRKECSNYRGITLISQCAKIYERILEKRVRDQIETKMREEQYGFRKNRSTIDLIFTIRNMMEKKWEKREDLYMTFLDLEKAFDNLPREKVWECLRKKEVEEGTITRIQSMYKNCKSRVRTLEGHTDWITVEKGVRQGSVMSPLLFIVVMDEMLGEVENGEEGDSKTGIYADDILIWGNKDDVQLKVTKWEIITEKYGMKVSKEKSESVVMQRGKRTENKIVLKNGNIEEREEFKYLGSVITNEAKLENEVKRRIQQGENFYMKVRKLLWNENFPKRCKVLFYKLYFEPILMYGVATWNLSYKEERMMEAAQMKFIRSIEGVTKMEKIKSKVLRKNVKVERLGYKVGKERLKLFGKLQKMEENRLPKKSLNMEYEKRGRGRPRERWIEKVQRDVEERGGDWQEIEKTQLWKDKEKWKKLISREEKEEDEKEFNS